jgi:hypothetical protein
MLFLYFVSDTTRDSALLHLIVAMRSAGRGRCVPGASDAPARRARCAARPARAGAAGAPARPARAQRARRPAMRARTPVRNHRRPLGRTRPPAKAPPAQRKCSFNIVYYVGTDFFLENKSITLNKMKSDKVS